MKADKAEITRLVRTARGQLDGVLKMIEEDRYCIDVSNQLMAAIAVLKKADREILKAHMRCCVRDAVENGDTDQKLEELAAVIDKLG
ncbi:MAG: metal-sensing transcriptional repressor [Ruminococcus sp.]|nr:metal-sensing transcriptional repressor [Ruminococcus sp.]